MKKNVFGKKLKRDKNERKALFKGLMSSLILYEKIETTEAKAKAIRPEIEKLVTKAKKGNNSDKKVLEKNLSRPAFDKIIKDIAPRFSNRNGGYIRIIKIGNRFGDNARAALLEWTEKGIQNPIENKKEEKKGKNGQKKLEKRVSKKVTVKKKDTKKTTKSK